MNCPACAAEIPADDLFCENCGLKLASAAPALCLCGAPGSEIDEDGFCLRCGRRVRRAAREEHAADHMEQSLTPAFAAVSDRGLRHDRNEDRFAIACIGEACAMAVCDGVSATRESEIASAAVAEGILAHLTQALSQAALADPQTLLRKAVASAAASLSASAEESNPPSTTVVAALIWNGQITLAWVGDSRAYWLQPSLARQLTQDHSWLNEVVSTGELTAEQAAKAPQAHAITRWLGADSTDQPAPDVVTLTLDAPGTLLLCTDGLWNYASTEEAMSSLMAQAASTGEDMLTVARHLVEFANGQGGQDNVTVALLRLPSAADGTAAVGST